jgi:hypothetical protein
MRRVAHPRGDLPDLLARRPWIDLGFAAGPAPGVSPTDQLRELVDLYERGLVTREELDRQRTKVEPSR